MKTIEEASGDYTYKNYGKRKVDAYIHEAFKAGVEFAQRWIQPKDEKPHNREVVLAKIPMINYPILFAYSETDNRWFQFEDGEFYISEITPTHWRPIEYK